MCRKGRINVFRTVKVKGKVKKEVLASATYPKIKLGTRRTVNLKISRIGRKVLSARRNTARIEFLDGAPQALSAKKFSVLRK